MWLDCATQGDIAEAIGIDQATISRWINAKSASADFALAPASRQNFDIWQFQTADKESG
jgi:transcriptional regulator with XRE-family HTH domain